MRDRAGIRQLRRADCGQHGLRARAWTRRMYPGRVASWFLRDNRPRPKVRHRGDGRACSAIPRCSGSLASRSRITPEAAAPSRVESGHGYISHSARVRCDGPALAVTRSGSGEWEAAGGLLRRFPGFLALDRNVAAQRRSPMHAFSHDPSGPDGWPLTGPRQGRDAGSTRRRCGFAGRFKHRLCPGIHVMDQPGIRSSVFRWSPCGRSPVPARWAGFHRSGRRRGTDSAQRVPQPRRDCPQRRTSSRR